MRRLPDPVNAPFASPLRLPPANIEAEQALLGAILADNRAYERVGEFLLPDHFADPLHARIYGAIRRRIEAGQLVDAVALRGEFEAEEMDSRGADGQYVKVKGAVYLAQLLRAMVGIRNADSYGRVIHDTWLRREVIAIGETLVDLSHGAEAALTGRDIVARGDEALLALTADTGGGGVRDGHQVGDALLREVAAAMERQGGLAGLTYGLRGLDRISGGLRPGQFVLIAGRPSMGKTSMANRMAYGAAAAGARVLFVSAEMRAQDVMAREVCAEARLPLSAYIRGGLVDPMTGQFRRLAQDEFDRLTEATMRIGASSVTWDDESVTIQQIRARARKLQRAKGGGLDMIVVDYLGRMRASENVQRFGLNSVVTELSAGFKDLAKQLGIPVVVLSQLSREVERRDDKTPLLSDLRDSGSLEQDADVVIFLYRAHYYLTRGEPKRGPKEKAEAFDLRLQEWHDAMRREKGKALAIVAKQRQGPTGPVRLAWDDETARFGDETEGEG
jgi:replicative DNA helicase